MANSERYARDPAPGLPEVTPDLIAAYNTQPHSFEAEYSRLKAEQAALAHELVTGVQGIDPHYLAVKRAFVQGALYMYGVLRTAAQAELLRQMFNETSSDVVDGEDRQP